MTISTAYNLVAYNKTCNVRKVKKDQPPHTSPMQNIEIDAKEFSYYWFGGLL